MRVRGEEESWGFRGSVNNIGSWPQGLLKVSNTLTSGARYTGVPATAEETVSVDALPTRANPKSISLTAPSVDEIKTLPAAAVKKLASCLEIRATRNGAVDRRKDLA